jgi:hypothetical protein
MYEEVCELVSQLSKFIQQEDYLYK